MVAHHPKEIRRCRVLERPRPDVLAERGIEPILAEHLVAEHLHHESGLLVSDPEQIVDFSRVGDERLLFAHPGMVRVEMQRMHFDRVAIGRTAEVFGGIGEIDESVEALVHPWIQSLVGADDHREPLVPELVRDHPLLIFTRRTVRRESQHRVLHSLDRAFDGRRVRPRVAIPLLAEVLDRFAPHAIDFGPLVGGRSIEALDQNPVVAARVPSEVGTGGEGEVAHVRRRVMPHQRRHRIERRQFSLGVDARPRFFHGAHFIRANDRNRGVGFSRRHQ